MFSRIKLITPRIFQRFNSTNDITGSFQYTRLTTKSYIKIWGPDTIKFLNGMITSKLQPHFIKKNLMTINANDKSQINEGSIINFPLNESNWGLYQEDGPHGEYISKFGQYTGFLNGKGKLITNSIIYNTSQDLKYPEFLVEFDKGIIFDMIKDFESHKLGSKIKFQSLKEDKFNSWDIRIKFNNIPKNIENPWIDNLIDPMSQMKTPKDARLFYENVMNTLFNGDKDVISCFVDNRFNKLIYKDGQQSEHFRLITSKNCQDVGGIFNVGMMPFPIETKQLENDSVAFRKDRLQNGFIDGVKDVLPTTLLPLECNFDYLPNVINSNKGCYVGQELTARTISTGILRKRVVSVIIDKPELMSEFPVNEYIDVELDEKFDVAKSNMAPSPFTTATDNNTKLKKKKPVGTLLTSQDEIGLVLLRTDYFPLAFNKSPDVADKFHITAPRTNTRVNITPIRPIWYEEWVKSQMKR